MSSRQSRRDLKIRSRKYPKEEAGFTNISINSCDSEFPEKGVDASTYMGN